MGYVLVPCWILVVFLTLGPQDSPATKWIELLDAESADERDRAERELVELGPAVARSLESMLDSSTLERKTRITRILREISSRAEEREVRRLGLPARLARVLPRLPERLASNDPNVRRDLHREAFDRDPVVVGGAPPDPHDLAALLGALLEREKTPELIGELIERASRERIVVPEAVLRALDLTHPGIRGSLRQWGLDVPLPGSEECIADLLETGDEPDRLKAVEALCAIGSPRALRLAQKGLRDPAPGVRVRTIRRMSRLLPRPILPGLEEGLRDPAPAVRAATIEALLTLGADDEAGRILELRADKDPFVICQVLAAIGLWRITRGFDLVLQSLDRAANASVLEAAIRAAGQTGDPAALPRLVALLESPVDAVALQAAIAIARLSTTAPAGLLQAARRDDPRWRYLSLIALSRSTHRDALDLFVRESASEEPRIRGAAISGLARWRGPESFEALRNLARSPADRKALVQALAESDVRPATPVLLDLLDHEDPEVCPSTVGLCARWGVFEAIPKLEGLARSDRPSVTAAAAVDALRRLEGKAADVRFLRLLDAGPTSVPERMWAYVLENPDDVLLARILDPYSKSHEGSWDGLVHTLAKVDSELSRRLLRQIGERGGEAFRTAAVLELARRGDPWGVPPARVLLEGSDEDRRRWAAAALLSGGTADPEALRVQCAVVRASTPGGLGPALRPLFACRRPEAAQFLAGALSDIDRMEPPDREALGIWMRECRSEAVDSVLRKLATGKEEERRGAAWALRTVAVPERAALLKRLLGDSDATVRATSADTLGSAPECDPQELAGALTDRVPMVRRAAVRSLLKVSPGLLTKSLPALAVDAAPSVRRAVAEAIEATSLPGEAAVLSLLLKDEDDRVRRCAVRAARGSSAEGVAAELEHLWNTGPAGGLRLDVARTLLSLGGALGFEAARTCAGDAGIALDLLERGDGGALPRILASIREGDPAHEATCRVLFAINHLTEPEFYRRLSGTAVDMRNWKGTYREWWRKLSEIGGFEIDGLENLPALLLDRPARQAGSGTLRDQLCFVGARLNLACVLADGKATILTRSAAVQHWEAWDRNRR
jgi:HEAT repeat protein